jgi:hypothetical protein
MEELKMKKFTEIMVTVAMVATLVCFGYIAGTHRDAIMKWYNYCRYLAAQNTQEVISSDGELMNAAQNNWVESHGKGETVVRMLSVEDGINGRLEQEAREENKAQTFIGSYEQITAMAYTHPGVTFEYRCTDEDFFRTEGTVTYEGDWFSGVYHWEGLNR